MDAKEARKMATEMALKISAQHIKEYALIIDMIRELLQRVEAYSINIDGPLPFQVISMLEAAEYHVKTMTHNNETEHIISW